MPSMQVPPFSQGAEAHSLMFDWHVAPVNPGLQSQKNELTPSTHEAALMGWQGVEAHSLMLVWHRIPVNPGAQRQPYESMPSWQVPPFWQGREMHSLMFV